MNRASFLEISFQMQNYYSEITFTIFKYTVKYFLLNMCQVVRIGKRNPEWLWLKDKEGENPQKQKKEGPRTRVRTTGKTNSPPGQPNLHRAGSGGGEKNTQKEEPKLGWGCSSLSVFWVGPFLYIKDIYSFAFYIQLSCNRKL